MYWCQCSDKTVFRDGVITVDVDPGFKKTVDLELGKVSNTENYLNLELRKKDDGAVVAYEQFVINEFENIYDELEADQPLLISDTYGSLKIMSDDMCVRFERRERNQLYSIKLDGEEILSKPMRLNFWRALTDNDRGSRAGTRLGCWRDAGDTPGIYNNTKWGIEGYKILDEGKKVVVVSGATVCTQPESKAQIVYTITSKGMEIELKFYPHPSLP